MEKADYWLPACVIWCIHQTRGSELCYAVRPSVPFTLAQDGGITLPRCRSDVTILCHCCCRTGLTTRPYPCQSCSGPPLSHNFHHSLTGFPSLGQINLPCACWASGIATAVNPPFAALSHFVVVTIFVGVCCVTYCLHVVRWGRDNLCPNLSLEKFFVLPVFPSLCLKFFFCAFKTNSSVNPVPSGRELSSFPYSIDSAAFIRALHSHWHIMDLAWYLICIHI